MPRIINLREEAQTTLHHHTVAYPASADGSNIESLEQEYMIVTFYESAPFARVREELFQGDDNYRRFQNALMANLRAGNQIQGTHGAYKVRWGDDKRGKGKSSGIRVIYYYHQEMDRVIFLLGYKKTMEDITPEQKRWCAEYISEFRMWREEKHEHR